MNQGKQAAGPLAAGTSTSEPGNSQTSTAMRSWLMANNVESISSLDEIYRYDRKQQQDMLTAKPWEKE